MNMAARWINRLFLVAGLYDAILGAAFLLFGPQIFRYAAVTPPNHFGYIHFPALLLIIFGVMFLRIATDPLKNRELMLYGVALKASYCGVVFWYDLATGIPRLWLPWAWADLLFLVLFIIAWLRTGVQPKPQS
jgi:hypothetical protein